jgi:poly-gamma-glutamate capsule biosynthesis protein CapA/YwtB (metallophosphatase superfamily)
MKRLRTMVLGLGLLAVVGSPGSTGPLGTARSPVHRSALVIHGAGDVSLDPTFLTTLRRSGYARAWSGVGGLFRRDDLTVVNLECPVSRLGSPLPKAFTFECAPAALPAMRAAGVEVASLGNNHAYDYGQKALLDSRRNLISAGIAPVGAGDGPEEATEPALFHVKGWTVAVLGIDEVIVAPEEVAALGHPGTACGADVACMVGAIRRAAAIADFVVVYIHWGVDLDTLPREYQVAQAHRLIEAGADVIFGGHPHRLQPLEIYRGRPIFYSLGNFVWPHLSEGGSCTGIAEVVVRPDGTVGARLIPTHIASDGHPVPGSDSQAMSRRCALRRHDRLGEPACPVSTKATWSSVSKGPPPERTGGG